MLSNIYYLIFGLILGIIFIYVCFGFEIKEKSKPKIKINCLSFIKDSHIVICDRHLHHWFISFVTFGIINLTFNNNSFINLANGFLIVLMYHGLLYKDCFDFSVEKYI